MAPFYLQVVFTRNVDGVSLPLLIVDSERQILFVLRNRTLVGGRGKTNHGPLVLCLCARFLRAQASVERITLGWRIDRPFILIAL